MEVWGEENYFTGGNREFALLRAGRSAGDTDNVTSSKEVVDFFIRLWRLGVPSRLSVPRAHLNEEGNALQGSHDLYLDTLTMEVIEPQVLASYAGIVYPADNVDYILELFPRRNGPLTAILFDKGF